MSVMLERTLRIIVWMIHIIFLGAVTILRYHHRSLIRIMWIHPIHNAVEYGLDVSIATEVVRLVPDFPWYVEEI